MTLSHSTERYDMDIMPFTHISLEFDGGDCATTKLMYIPERHFSFCRLCRFRRTCSAMAGYGDHDQPPMPFYVSVLSLGARSSFTP